MRYPIRFYRLAVALVLSACLLPIVRGQESGQPARQSDRPQYPRLKTSEVVEDYHGTEVADPFRWLEDAEAPDTRAFIDAQNRITRHYLDLPVRDVIRARLQQLIDYPRVSSPSREKDRLFFTRNTGLQNQSVLFMKPQNGGEEIQLIDPNEWSEDGTVALAGTSVSDDASTMIYGKSAPAGAISARCAS